MARVETRRKGIAVWDTDGGVYFGYATNATEESARPKIGKEQTRYVGDRHLMTIGPNGSGKSRRVLLVNIAQLKGWSIVVVDPKGDLCAMTRDYRENHGAKSVILNPFGVLGLQKPRLQSGRRARCGVGRFS